jgi:trehalose 6-phosphate synthase/phosphatase
MASSTGNLDFFSHVTIGGRCNSCLINYAFAANFCGNLKFRWKKDEPWETPVPIADFSWKEVVSPVLKLYTESTDGSYIEAKESALVWHYQDADPDFGAWQAKELLDHLESVLANEPVCVKSGQQIIEIKPQVRVHE